MDSDKTVDRNELQMASQKKGTLGALIAEAKLNPDSVVFGQLDTNKDGRVNWEETEQVENRTVEEKAEARLREIFKLVDSTKTKNTANKEELATKLCAEKEGFKTLLVEAGLNMNFEALKQLDGGSNRRGTLDNCDGKLKEVAEAEVNAAGGVAAVAEIKIEWIIGD